MTPEEQAALDAAQEKQIRDLATQITQMAKLGFDPMTIRKGTIAAVNDIATPPTVSLNISGDTNTTVTEVRTLNNYTPLVGQTVLIGKQGTEIFILGAIASISPKTAASQPSVMENGWIKATLTNGTHGGSGNDVYYRRVLDHGAWKMQWRGQWMTTGDTFMIDTADALDPEYRPSSFRAIAVAREATDLTTLRMDFGSDGLVRLWHSLPDASTGGAGGFSLGNHTHAIPFDGDADGGGADHNHFGSALGAGGFSLGDHSHSASVSIVFPTWVSLNGVEYFL